MIEMRLIQLPMEKFVFCVLELLRIYQTRMCNVNTREKEVTDNLRISLCERNIQVDILINIINSLRKHAHTHKIVY